MNTKIDRTIRDAIIACQSVGIKIVPGAWFELEGEGENEMVKSCDPIFAVIFTEGDDLIFRPGLDLSRPGFVRKACTLLDVDPGWLHRFWLGWDRGHHVTIVRENNDEEFKDEVSGYAIQLRKEYLK